MKTAKQKGGKRKPKTTAKLKNDLWTVFSRYIRLRDAIRTTGDIKYGICVTCDKTYPTIDLQAGHFISKKVCNALRFHEQNVHAQCEGCNGYRFGEQDLYAQAIERMYGKEVLEILRRARYEVKRDSRPELLALTALYKGKLNELIKTHGSPWM